MIESGLRQIQIKNDYIKDTDTIISNAHKEK